VSLDPILLKAETQRGEQRFHENGSHPATKRLQASIRALEAHRAQIVGHIESVAPHDDPKMRGFLESADEMIERARLDLAAFEEGESIAKADYLRYAEGR
jgi:hypothetical protein